MVRPKIALTITGTDPIGDASVMVDLKSFHPCGVYGMGIVTNIVVQDALGVQHVHNLNHRWVDEQLGSAFNDTLPHAIKTGMIATADTMETIRHYLMQHESIPCAVDPVMLTKSGDSLMDNDAKQNLQHTLLLLADIVTPNLPETGEMTGLAIDSEEKVMQAGRVFINEIGSKGVIIKGDHSNDINIAKDYLFTNEDVQTFENERFKTKHTHRTGYTFSAAITAEPAEGRPLFETIHEAEEFISMSIQYTPEIGRGRGPADHFTYLKKEESDDELSR